MKIFCWYCDKEIKRKNNGKGFGDGEGMSSHHFFNYTDVKYRLMRLFGEPKTDEEAETRLMMVKMIFDNMAKFPVHIECHKEIEDKLK